MITDFISYMYIFYHFIIIEYLSSKKSNQNYNIPWHSNSFLSENTLNELESEIIDFQDLIFHIKILHIV